MMGEMTIETTTERRGKIGIRHLKRSDKGKKKYTIQVGGGHIGN